MNRQDLTIAARSLLQHERQGILSTHSVKAPGYPFGSLMPYALDNGLRPLFLISSMAVHTKNLISDPRASLAVVEPAKADPAVAPGRMTLLGDVIQLAGGSAEAEAYLARHPEARQWIGFGDFAFWRLETKSIYFVAGFGAMGWLDATALTQA